MSLRNIFPKIKQFSCHEKHSDPDIVPGTRQGNRQSKGRAFCPESLRDAAPPSGPLLKRPSLVPRPPENVREFRSGNKRFHLRHPRGGERRADIIKLDRDVGFLYKWGTRESREMRFFVNTGIPWPLDCFSLLSSQDGQEYRFPEVSAHFRSMRCEKCPGRKTSRMVRSTANRNSPYISALHDGVLRRFPIKCSNYHCLTPPIHLILFAPFVLDR
jgi:hypothetical protein